MEWGELGLLRSVGLVGAGLTLLSFGLSDFASGAEKPLNYDRDVRPILAENCFYCHGQDSKKRMAGLRLDTPEGASAERHGHRPVVPGKPEESLMYQRISEKQPARRMPPPFANRTLTSEQIATLKRWIQEGGHYTKHWAFVPPVRPAVPQPSDAAWVKNPIDAFVLKRLEEEGLHPSPPAAPAAWLRRVSFDLVGLPPTPAEIDAFVADVQKRGEAAYAAAADRMLASPRYGERMAMDWMDVARYADTHGFNNDAARSMWRWRDWVIQSFNQNLPYDRFITDQLAGDLLPHPTLDDRIATGFGRNHGINSEGGIIDEEYRVSYVTDRVRTLGMAWLGLTLECAHCHDHKFDPITQRDHYRFFAFFNNVAEMGEDGRVANAAPIMAAPTAEQQKQMADLQASIATLDGLIEKREMSWKWRNRDAARVRKIVSRAAEPQGSALQMRCESAAGFETPPASGFLLNEGISGKACVTAGANPKPVTGGPGVPVSARHPMTFSLWLRPEASDQDVPLLSTVDYATNPAATAYGKGIELRLVGGELEFRFADRFPGYAIRVRSKEAHIAPGAWRQLTLIYSGVPQEGADRAYAAWVRMFADGRELPTEILNDGLGLPGKKSKPALTHFRVGWDNSHAGARFAGRLDEIAFWPRALSSDEIAGLFDKQALPYAVARERRHDASPAETAWVREALLLAADPALARQESRRERLRGELLSLQRNAPAVMVMAEMATPRETHILLRGSYNSLGEKVEPGVPEELLGAWPKGAPKNRLGLAEWLTKPDHPLTSRVVVNRFWQQLFGTGIVKTSDNFGMQGEWPSHPELLDWLAREFVDSGWNVKALLRQMVLSATYRQDSAASKELVARDPENRLLARGPRFRLPAELIRDQALQISGLLKNRLGGPSVYPYQPPNLYKGIVVAADYPGTKYLLSTGDDLYRRSLYTFWKRTVPHPTLAVFDAPDRESCIVRRSITNTPLQALTLLNDPIYVEASRKLAERSILRGGASPDARLAFAFRLAAGRAPDADELRILRKTLDEMLAAYRGDEKGAEAYVAVGSASRDTSISAPELAAYTAVANMILNLDEVITKD